ncbi:hypothetical protein NL676_004649 [Syzygium grande]|nr:hypothetical protein NL676_004649 [Syzygium grande]
MRSLAAAAAAAAAKTARIFRARERVPRGEKKSSSSPDDDEDYEFTWDFSSWGSNSSVSEPACRIVRSSVWDEMKRVGFGRHPAVAIEARDEKLLNRAPRAGGIKGLNRRRL